MALGRGLTGGQIMGWLRDPDELLLSVSHPRSERCRRRQLEAGPWAVSQHRQARWGGVQRPPALTPCLLHRPFAEICTEAKQTGKGRAKK